MSGEHGAPYAVMFSAGAAAREGYVLHTCEREGSLDSAIVDETLAPNDFGTLFSAYPAIERVFFNGAKAANIFDRRVRPVVAHAGIAYRRLPSTSPANAAVSYAAKLAAWRAIVE